MKVSAPIKNMETYKWEVYRLAYYENGERFYRLLEFDRYCDAIAYWDVNH